MNNSSTLVITEDRVSFFFLFFFSVLFSFVYPAIKTAPKLREPCFPPQPFLSSHYLISEARVESYLCSLLLRQMKRDAAWLTEHSRLARQIGSNIPYHFSSPSMIFSSQLYFNESSIRSRAGLQIQRQSRIDWCNISCVPAAPWSRAKRPAE